MRVDYGGQIHEFPDDFSEAEIAHALSGVSGAGGDDPEIAAETQRILKEQGDKPQVPFSGPEGDITPAQRARANVQMRREKEKFEQGRTVPRRIQDTLTFGAALPIRMATKGEYGLADIAEKGKGLLAGVDDAAIADIRRGEQDFARANETGLGYVQAAGDIGAGIPALGTLGQAGAATSRLRMMGPKATLARSIGGTAEDIGDFVSDARGGQIGKLMESETGAGKLPGGPRLPKGLPPAEPPLTAAPLPPEPPTPPPPPNSAGALPGAPEPPRPMGRRNSLIAAGERIGVPISKAVAGSSREQQITGAMKSMPHIGDPLTFEYDRGLLALGRAGENLTEDLGRPGAVNAGTDVKIRLSDWMKNPTALDDTLVSKLYDDLDKQVKSVPVNLGRTRAIVKEFEGLKQRSTTGAYNSAINELKGMINLKKFPKGMPFRDILEKRKEIGSLMKDKLVKDIDQQALSRAYAALTEDLKFAIKRGGGRKGLDMFEEANAAAQNAHEIRGAFEKIIGKDGKFTPERTIAAIEGMMRPKGDIGTLRLLRRVMPDEEFRNLGATFAEKLGINNKGEFSPAHLLSQSERYSPAARRVVFGESNAALNDMREVSRAYDKWSQNFNHSKSGTVLVLNGMMKILLNPTLAAASFAGGFVNPMAWAHTGATAAGIGAARSAAWAMARPAVMDQAAKLLKVYARAQRRNMGMHAAAASEASFETALKGYAAAVARETGEDAASVQARIEAQIRDLRSE